MRTEAFRNHEVECQQFVPFAMLFAEEAPPISVAGQYNEKTQVWEGMAASEFSSAPTATSTSTYTQKGADADYDQDWAPV